jgi:hypothetical protein
MVASLVVNAVALLGCQDLRDRPRKEVVLSSPNEAPAAEVEPGRKHYLVTPGKVLPQYFMRSEWRAPSASRTPGPPRMNSRGVVPIVDEAWQKGDPIPLWASGAWLNHPKAEWVSLLPEREAEEKAWVAALQTALKQGPIRGPVSQIVGKKSGEGSAEHEAIAKLEAQEGLKSDPRAPVISFDPPKP